MLNAQKMVPGTFRARLFMCPLCGKELTYGGMGLLSHFRNHVKNGDITSEQSLEIRKNLSRGKTSEREASDVYTECGGSLCSGS